MNTTKGTLEIICGGMFSGKSSELISRLERAEIAKKRCMVFKNSSDARRKTDAISTHDGREYASIPIANNECDKILEMTNHSVDVVAIDEIQFFNMTIIDTISSLLNDGKRVIVSGLDMDSHGLPFGIIHILLTMAEHITKLHAVCNVCGADASFSQNIIDGRPATFENQTQFQENTGLYEARCRTHFFIELPDKLSTLILKQFNQLYTQK